LNRLEYLLNRAKSVIKEFKICTNSVTELEVTTKMMENIKDGATTIDLNCYEELISKVELLIIIIKQKEI
jgi:hypothetical protein